MGAVSPRSVIQITDIDSGTRVDIWNVLHVAYSQHERTFNDDGSWVLIKLWASHWRLPLDRFSQYTALGRLREAVMKGSYIECLGVVEAYVQAVSQKYMVPTAEEVSADLDVVFERNLVGYRFVDYELIPVTNDEEVAAIEDALSDLGKFDGARAHLSNAIRFLADRDEPHYAKSVAESISAVEAIVRMMTGQKSLGKGLAKMKGRGFVIHGALESSWSTLYGYTSDEKGVRHGSIEASDVDEKLATYMLVTCSAFVSLLLKVEAETSTTT